MDLSVDRGPSTVRWVSTFRRCVNTNVSSFGGAYRLTHSHTPQLCNELNLALPSCCHLGLYSCFQSTQHLLVHQAHTIITHIQSITCRCKCTHSPTPTYPHKLSNELNLVLPFCCHPRLYSCFQSTQHLLVHQAHIIITLIQSITCRCECTHNPTPIYPHKLLNALNLALPSCCHLGLYSCFQSTRHLLVHQTHIITHNQSITCRCKYAHTLHTLPSNFSIN